MKAADGAADAEDDRDVHADERARTMNVRRERRMGALPTGILEFPAVWAG
jgi:hypothetical protein